MIDRAVGETKSSQVLIASHDPVVISRLRKEQVRQLSVSRDSGEIVASAPSEDLVSIGVAGVLLSELFGFRSMLATEVVGLMEEREHLLAREGDRDEARLAELNRLLSEVDHSSVHPDPLFGEFVRQMMARHREDLVAKPLLTADEVREQRQLAREVLEEIREREAGE